MESDAPERLTTYNLTCSEPQLQRSGAAQQQQHHALYSCEEGKETPAVRSGRCFRDPKQKHCPRPLSSTQEFEAVRRCRCLDQANSKYGPTFCGASRFHGFVNIDKSPVHLKLLRYWRPYLSAHARKDSHLHELLQTVTCKRVGCL